VKAWPDLSEPKGRRATAYERHYPDAFRFALRLAEDEHRAENATVLAFARCFARLDHLRDDTVLETSLLREVWRSSVPRVGRRAHVATAAEALAQLGFPEAQIETILPTAREDMWTVPAGSESEGIPEVVPDREGLRRALKGGTRRLTGMLAAACLLGASVTAVVTMERDVPKRTPAVQPGLPGLLPQGYAPTGPRIQVVRGTLGEERWMVNAYAAEKNTVCIELRVARSYGDVHCPDDFKVPIRAFVGPDSRHHTTFIYGYVRSDVTDVSIKEVTAAPVGVQIGRNSKALGFKEPGGFFAVTVPDYLFRLTSRQLGEKLGYTIFELRLRASGANGKRLGMQRVLLGRPN